MKSVLAWLLLLAASSGPAEPGSLPQAPSAAEGDFVVIVHPSISATTVRKSFLADAFLKKTTSWSDGQSIRPVDQAPTAGVREHFSKDVLGRPVSVVRNYWQQKIFTGRGVPPPELDTDADVVAYVLKYPGAVGYVSGTADRGGARVLTVE